MRRALVNLVVLAIFLSSIAVVGAAFYDEVGTQTFQSDEKFDVEYNTKINLSANSIDNVTACCETVYNSTGVVVPTSNYTFYDTAQIEIPSTSTYLDNNETARIEYQYDAPPELERSYAATFDGVFGIGGNALLLIAGAGVVIAILVVLIGMTRDGNNGGGGR